jgi:ribosomal protein L37AE/L43A
MDGILGIFLALLIALVAVGVVLAGRRRPSGINPTSRHCTRCQTPMSLRRVSLLRSLVLLGEWVCPHCGNRIKAGKRAPGTAAQRTRPKARE